MLLVRGLWGKVVWPLARARVLEGPSSAYSGPVGPEAVCWLAYKVKPEPSLTTIRVGASH